MNNNLHTCRFCGIPKPSEAFHRHPFTKHNIDRRCKQCKRERRLAVLAATQFGTDIEAITEFDPFEVAA